MKSIHFTHHLSGRWGFKHSFWSVNQWDFVRQTKQQPNPIRGPSCHMSSFRLQEMDVLHFTAYNICRGNHSTPQRACAIVLKLSISCFFERTIRGPRAKRVKGSRRRTHCLRVQILLLCTVTLALGVSCLVDKERNLVKWQ